MCKLRFGSANGNVQIVVWLKNYKLWFGSRNDNVQNVGWLHKLRCTNCGLTTLNSNTPQNCNAQIVIRLRWQCEICWFGSLNGNVQIVVRHTKWQCTNCGLASQMAMYKFWVGSTNDNVQIVVLLTKRQCTNYGLAQQTAMYKL